MPKLTLKGRIDITSPTRNDGVERVEITIGDVDACSEVLTVHLELADFARALTGTGRLPCAIETSTEQLGHVGTKHESKTEFVPDVGETSLFPFCVHGWRPRPGDFGNHHRWWVQDGKKGYTVSFFRNVKKEPDVTTTPDENATSGGRGLDHVHP